MIIEQNNNCKNNLHHSYDSIDEECNYILKEFKDISSNPVMMYLQEDLIFFQKNLEKIKNME